MQQHKTHKMKYSLQKTKDGCNRHITIVTAFVKDIEVGRLYVDKSNYVISVYVEPNYRKLGIGTNLYRYALKKLGKLGSWGCTCVAEKIWNRLEKRHKRINSIGWMCLKL